MARSRTPLLIGVLTAGFALLTVAGPATAATTQATVGIFDDDSGRPLFPATTLAPGRAAVRCLSVGATGALSGDHVDLAALDVAGALASGLDLTVESGSGGDYTDCSSFVPTGTVFTGTLAALAAVAGTGVATGWSPDLAPVRSFRFTVRLAGGVTTQGAAATGRFVWTLTRPGGVPSTSTTTPTTTTPTGTTPTGVTADPTDEVPVESSAPAPTSAPTSVPASGPPATTSPTAVRPAELDAPLATTTMPPVRIPDDPAAPDPVPPRPPDITLGTRLAEVLHILRRAQEAVIAVASEPQYPLGVTGVAFSFLLVQDLIDRRDPKLVNSTRSQRDNELVFPDRFGTGIGW